MQNGIGISYYLCVAIILPWAGIQSCSLPPNWVQFPQRLCNGHHKYLPMRMHALIHQVNQYPQSLVLKHQEATCWAAGGYKHVCFVTTMSKDHRERRFLVAKQTCL